MSLKQFLEKILYYYELTPLKYQWLHNSKDSGFDISHCFDEPSPTSTKSRLPKCRTAAVILKKDKAIHFFSVGYKFQCRLLLLLKKMETKKNRF